MKTKNNIQNNPIKTGLKTLLYALVLFFCEQLATANMILLSRSPSNTLYAFGVFVGLITSILWTGSYIIDNNQKNNLSTFTWQGNDAFNYKMPRILLLGIGVTLIMFTFTLIVSSIERYGFHVMPYSANESSLHIQLTTNPMTNMLLFIIYAGLGPFVEEFIFRYLLIKPANDPLYCNKNRKPILSRNIRTILSAVIFTVIHIIAQISNVNNFASIVQFISTTLIYATLAVILSLIYYKKSGLVTNTVVHGVYNFIAILLTLN